MKSQVESAIDYLCSEISEFEDEREGFVYNEADGLVTVPFYEDTVIYPVSQFLNDVEESKEISIKIEAGAVLTKRRHFQVIEPDGESSALIWDYKKELVSHTADGMLVSTKYSNLIIVIAAYKSDAYHRKYFPPYDYMAIEVVRPNTDESLNQTRAEQLVSAFLFELADSHDIVFTKSGFSQYDEYYQPDFARFEAQSWPLRPLEQFNEGIHLYLAALQVTDPELRLLSFYKVLEYFSSVAFDLDANDALRKKLDSPNALSPNNAYLRSIFELTRNVDLRRNDREQMKSLFAVSLDMVELSPLLPDSLKQEVSYKSKPTDVGNYARRIAEVLVATRNQVAHAKSNHSSIGSECSAADLPEFNKFLKAAAAQTIRWFNRLPEHQRMFV
jgi:hypothetical protein